VAVGKEVSRDGKECRARTPRRSSQGRSEFKVGTTWFKRDTSTGRILNGSPKQHKGVRNEK
jgi:hypothetical protein